MIGLAWNGQGSSPTFSEIVLNVCSFRNIGHFHLKIWFDATDFIDRVTRWPTEKLKLLSDLRELRRLMKLRTEEDLLSIIGDETNDIELLVKGKFKNDDEQKLLDKFSMFGRVVSIECNSSSHADGAEVIMATAKDAIAAIKFLNLSKMGYDVMCKVKVVKQLKGKKKLQKK